MDKTMELYLDANAHVPMSKNAIAKFTQFNQITNGHPSSPSAPGTFARQELEASRNKIAELLGCESNQLIFTSTCTQACQWGIKIMSNLYDTITYSSLEHSAIRDAIDYYFHKDENYSNKSTHVIPTKKSGVIDIDDSYKLITTKTIIHNSPIVCIHVQNELGTIQPIEKIKNLNSSFIFSDMCQTVGKCDLSLKDFPVDIATFGAHKFGGPAGVGILYLKDYSLWQEFGTGSRYFNDRPGTPDVASIVSTAAALEESIQSMPQRLSNMIEFQTIIEDEFANLGIEIIGKSEARVPNTTFIKIENSLDLLLALSENGIHVGLGSACGSMYTESSPTMKAIGETGSANDYMRISQHGDYGKKEALHFLNIFKMLM